MGRAGFDRAGLVLAQTGPGREGGLGQCGGGGHAAQYMTSPICSKQVRRLLGFRFAQTNTPQHHDTHSKNGWHLDVRRQPPTESRTTATLCTCGFTKQKAGRPLNRLFQNSSRDWGAKGTTIEFRENDARTRKLSQSQPPIIQNPPAREVDRDPVVWEQHAM